MQTSRWPVSKLPIAHLKPFPYHKGELYVELLDRLAKYVTQQLHPNLRETVEHVVEEMEHIIADTHAKYVEGIQDFQRIHDAFMTDVNSALMALNDNAVTDLVSDPGSALGKELSSRFEQRSRNNTKNYTGSAQQRLEAALADHGVVQFDETFTHTDNIPGFWDTPIYGTGTIVLPGGGTFTPDPHPVGTEIITNTLYLNELTGSPTADGLTPATAMDSVSTVYNTVLKNLTAQQAAGARWVIRMSGEFTSPTPIMNKLPDFPYGLVFQGDDLQLNRPTTTMRYVSGRNMGLYFEPGVDTVTVENIHFKDYKVGSNGYGVIMKYGGHLTVKNCEFTKNDIGVAAIQGTDFSIVDNVFNPGHSTAISTQYNATGHANRNTMDGGGVDGGVGGDTTGVRFSRGVNAHFDDNIVRGYLRGMYVDMSSRVASPGNTFGRCRTGVLVSSAAEWNNNGNTFEPTNAEHYRHDGAGREVRLHSEGVHKALDYRFFTAHSLSEGAHRSFPNLESRTMIYNTGTVEFPAQWFENPGKTITFKLAGELKDSNGYSVVIEIGTVTRDGADWKILSTLTMPAGTGDKGGFVGEAVVNATGKATQSAYGVIHGKQTRAFVRESTTNFGEDRLFRVYAYATGGAPVDIDFTALDIYVAG